MFPTSVNDQVTDALSQTLVANIGTAQQTGAAVVQQCYAQAMALGMQNAAARQQQAQLVADTLMSAALMSVAGKERL